MDARLELMKLQQAGLMALGGMAATQGATDFLVQVLARALKDSGVDNCTHLDAILEMGKNNE